MIILVNLKAYPCDPVAVAEAVHAVAEDTGVRIAVAPQTARLGAVAATGAETWAQDIAPIEHGSHTGSTLPESVPAAGATGTLVNHSECRRRLADIDGAIRAADRAGLETIVCANNPSQVAAAAALAPDAVAVEPPALIGTGTPVSRADPGVIEDAVRAVRGIDESIQLLCGAGISTGDDLAAALELGAEGVLLASGVAKADDPRTVLEDLVAPVA